MNKNFAIRGHLRRGDEVIKILETLGGKTSYECSYKDGFDSSYFFFINTDENFSIDGLAYNSDELKNYYIFTLEEFIKKFPYKVGDKVIYKSEVLPIIGMTWDCSRGVFIYTMKPDYGTIDCFDSTWMKPYKEETMEEIKVDIPKGYEFARVDKQKVVFTKIQIEYPKTYEECWKVRFEVDGETILDEFHHVSGYYSESLGALQKLLCCRDAYWKIAGEQMGLDEPWKPDWKDSDFKYCLKKMGDYIEKSSEMTISCILAFPTEEIRDIFYNNFKNIIEQCKELL